MLRTMIKKGISCIMVIMMLAGLMACDDPVDMIEGAIDAKAEITDELVDKYGMEALGLKPYLMQNLTYNDGTYGASGICETVYVHIDEEAHKMDIYEFGLYDTPDISLPWSSKETDSKIFPREDGVLSGIINNRAMGMTGYFRFDPVTMLKPGEWQDNEDGFRWYDIRYSESNRDGHLSEQFDPENADSQTIWRVDTTGETTLWDWAVFMEGNSIISDMFLAEAEALANENGYSMEGFKPGNEMMEEYETRTDHIPQEENREHVPDNLPEEQETPDESKDSEGSNSFAGILAKTKKTDAAYALDDFPVVWSSFNTYRVENKPEEEYTTVVLDEACRVTSITTYHWNDGNGAEPGKIALMQGNEKIGIWEAEGREGSGVQNALSDVFPDIILEPGEYRVYDSDPETWSCNEASGYVGFVELRGETLSGESSGNEKESDPSSRKGSPLDVKGDDFYGDVFDLREYEDEWIEEYGGSLEEKLAERLNTRVETGYDGDSKVICDGAIEFYPAVNGSGFFIWVYEPVDRFSVYGISVGMPEDNAVANLEANNLSRQDDGENGIYSSDFDRFYVRYDVKDGIVTKITYVKIYDR